MSRLPVASTEALSTEAVLRWLAAQPIRSWQPPMPVAAAGQPCPRYPIIPSSGLAKRIGLMAGCGTAVKDVYCGLSAPDASASNRMNAPLLPKLSQ